MSNCFHSISGLTIFVLYLAWLHFPPVQSQTIPGFIAQEDVNKILSQFPHLKEQRELLKDLKSSVGNQAQSDSLKELLKQQIIFSPLFQQKSTDPKDILDPIFEDVSSTCEEHFRYALDSLSSGIPHTWVIQMFDAYGKFPSGILSGHFSELGDFQECIDINGEFSREGSSQQVVKGRYAKTYLLPGPELTRTLEQVKGNRSSLETLTTSPELSPSASFRHLIENTLAIPNMPSLMFTMGTCFPESCSQVDIQQILSSFHKRFSKDLLSQLVIETYIKEKPSFDAADYAMIVILVLIGCLCLAGSLLDIQQSMKAKSSQANAGFATKLVLAFSFYTNTKKWSSTRAGSDNLGCLHGLRFMSMSWVVLCHTYTAVLSQPTWNRLSFGTFYKDWTLAPMMNGTPAVDTFFTMSGALVAYNLLKELDKTKGKFNYALFVIHRYLRLTPTYLILVGVMATLLPYLGNGPNWSSMESASEGCRKNWWHNALYINNLVKYDNSPMCYSEAWYLANDMQFYLLSPLVIYPLWRWKRIGFGILAVLSVVSVIIPAWIIADKNLPPTMVITINMKTFFTDIYYKPWARFGPYVVGLGLGSLLHYRTHNLGKFRSIPKLIIAAGWAIGTALALAVIFGGMRYFDPENAEDTYSAFHTAAYGGFHRTVWGISISWIIFACVSGYGGLVNKILSLKMFIPLGRLTFCMYITSYHIQDIYHKATPHEEHFSQYRAINIFFAHMVMSGLISYILTVTLESPFIQLEKMLFASRKQPRPVQQVQDLKSDQENASDVNGNSLSIKVES